MYILYKYIVLFVIGPAHQAQLNPLEYCMQYCEK